ncbi:uncharacterized protein LOC123310601 isoform X3 [Coccinella septempunctata]|uniref:uncharacterized protein LOC123310601 isoform X3 n=1 Tax=Coccinella septempunctata TaxID=41139 RepID=UPI001D0655A6|nr:uncharacterized protein LOC123310601 isoform X3 [Coccinella septempunctata]
MAKYLARIILITYFTTCVICLDCLSCTSKEACEDPPSTNCTPEKKYCLAVQGEGTYFRGCYDNSMDCEKLQNNPNVSFPVCVMCQTDNCNNQDLQ